MVTKNWCGFIENLAAISAQDHTLAMDIALKSIKDIETKYGAISNEMVTIKYYIGLISMLMNDYTNAENSFLSAMEIIEQCNGYDIKFYAEITKHLSLAYELKAHLHKQTGKL